MIKETDRLAKDLADYGYAVLLGKKPNSRLIESVKSEPEIALTLKSIINNRSIGWPARFMASEFLFRYVDMTLHSQCNRTSLQETYFNALRHNYTGNGIDWAFGKGPNELGIVGLMAIRLGKDNVEAFKAGLDDDQLVTMTFFWRIPSHFRPPYRVKDFAALILAKAHGLAIDLAGSPEDRDKVIAEVQQTMIREQGAPSNEQ